MHDLILKILFNLTHVFDLLQKLGNKKIHTKYKTDIQNKEIGTSHGLSKK